MLSPYRPVAVLIALAVLTPAVASLFVAARLASAARDPGAPAADPPPVVIDAPASEPFEHVRSMPLPPHVAYPLDIAISPDGELYVADGGRRIVEVVGADGAGRRQMTPPASIAVGGGEVVVPMALEHDAAAGTLDIVWQWHGRAPGATAPDYGGAWIERRTAGGEVLRAAALLPGVGRVADLAAHADGGDRYLARGGSIIRLEGGWTDVGTTLPITYTEGAPARIAVSGARLVLIAGGGASLHRLDGSATGTLDLGGHAAAAVGRMADGGFGVLVHAGEMEVDGAATAVLAYRATGARAPAGDLTVDAVGLAPPPAGGWNWAIAFAGPHSALTTARSDGIFATRRLGPAELTLVSPFDPDRTPTFPSFTPSIGTAVERLSGSVVVAPGADGGVLVAGCRSADVGDVSHGGCATKNAVLFRLSADAGFRGGRILDGGLTDVAAGPGGELFAAYAGARFVSGSVGMAPSSIERLGPAWAEPEWEVSCACEHGARIARAGGVVFAVEPATGEAVGRDVATGEIVRRIAAPGPGTGLWPADLAADDAGRLYAANTGRRLVERWSSGDAPDRSWLAGAGIGLGPRRIAHGRWNGVPVVASLASDGRVELHDADSGDLVLAWHPTRPDGSMIGAIDLAFDAANRLYLVDGSWGTVEILAPVDGPWEPPAPTPGPSPTPPPSACAVSGDKVAGPRRVALGETATITLTVRAECPPREDHVGADIVLAIHVGIEHRTVGAHDVMAFVEPWLGLVDTSVHRLGATTVMGGSAPVIIPLGATPLELLHGLGEIGPTWYGSAQAVPAQLARELLLTTKRPAALPIIVYVDASSDWGESAALRESMRVAGNAARLDGMLTYAIGLRGPREVLRDFSGADERTFLTPAVHETAAIMAHIMREAGSSLSGNLVVDDTMSDDVFYDIGSGIPRPIVASGASDLRWTRAVLPSTGMTMTFRVVPLRAGIIPTNLVAVARYDDVDGVRRELVYPIPEIEVFIPTPTPTPTATNTPEPTPTRLPEAIFLPFAVRSACARETMPLDVVLAIDVSSSMAGAKLGAAAAAARTFVRALELESGRDRAAIVAFDERAVIASRLTSDPVALDAALDGLSAGLGTRIDRALDAASHALGRAEERRPGAAGAIILLSDGAHGGPSADVRLAAESARAITGAAIWTIGLGTEADAALLRDVADPGAYRFAPDAAALEAVYSALTEEVGCG